MAKEGEDVEITELADYDEDNPEENVNAKQANGQKDGDSHVATHTTSFQEMLLRPELLRAITEAGFEHPSEVQSECLAQALMGTDILCQAKSGMGKTAVFVMAVLHQLMENKDENPGGPRALVLCHTRELAFQIAAEFSRFSKNVGITNAVFFGGVPIEQHTKILKESKPQIVIGTPGRILELANLTKKKKKGKALLNLKHISIFVLDECDKMLARVDMRADVQKIFLQTPVSKQVMMFSATIPEPMKVLCKKFMCNPLEIFVSDGEITLHGLAQFYLNIKEEQKTKKLLDLLDVLDFNQVMVFVSSPERAVELNKILHDCNFPSGAMHSRMPAKERTDMYENIKSHSIRVVVATNLAARGVDIAKVNVVINYDFPENSDTYLHRVGRAGRFGTKGLCISFVTEGKDTEKLQQVQARFSVQVSELPDNIDSSTYMSS